MKNVFLVTLIFLLAIGDTAFGQKFLPTIKRFSGSKPGQITLVSGEKIDMTVKKIKRKKTFVYKIKGRRTDDNSQFKYKAEQIKEMSLAPANWGKLMTLLESDQSVLTKAKTDYGQINREFVNLYQERIKRGKKKPRMMQLLNPEFEGKVRVYDDSRATSTQGIAVQGVNLTGGIKKSYYVRYKGKFGKIKKSQYKKLFKEYFGNCPALVAKYELSSWRDFPDHLYYYEQNCLEKGKTGLTSTSSLNNNEEQ
ncbi:hypothetical protein [Persicitalea sp.]|uniref:hypothetical protein n=1 Tax=Persicitalea sp. TaxID=3100273 RepID=UPI00359302F9